MFMLSGSLVKNRLLIKFWGVKSYTRIFDCGREGGGGLVSLTPMLFKSQLDTGIKRQ